MLARLATGTGATEAMVDPLLTRPGGDRAISVNGQFIYLDGIRNVAIVKQSSLPVASSPYFDDWMLDAFDDTVQPDGLLRRQR